MPGINASLPFPRGFLCEHSGSKHRVLALVEREHGPSYLQAVLSCSDPALAQRAAIALTAALDEAGSSTHQICEGVVEDLPHAPSASFKATLERVRQGEWTPNPLVPPKGPVDEFGEQPDFAALFRVPTCPGEPDESDAPEGETGCEACDSWWLTPRTADAIYSELCYLADMIHDDASELGDSPIEEGDKSSVLSDLPRMTWAQGRKWRKRIAHACEDLAHDLENGRLPHPRCTAEEVLLSLALDGCEGHVEDTLADRPEDTHHSLPRHSDDYDWDACLSMLYEDNDFLLLYEEETGFQELAEFVAPLGSSDDHLEGGSSEGWFRWFYKDYARDPRRTFRR